MYRLKLDKHFFKSSALSFDFRLPLFNQKTTKTIKVISGIFTKKRYVITKMRSESKAKIPN